MSRRKNILILTLGTGNLIKMRTVDAADIFQRSYSAETIQKDSVYYSTNYLYRNPEDGTEIQYPDVHFIADPLIRITNPDTVIILGTVKSAWSGLYKDFAERNSLWKVDTFRKLYNQECGLPVDLYGAETDTSALLKLQENLNQIFQDVSLFSGINGHLVETRVLLTRYGINDQDLKDNYQMLSGIEDVFSESDVSYHVSFDITHSFRSLPLYNLIILNYLKEVKQLPIRIDHVFYGNFDASHDSGMKRTLDAGEKKGDKAQFSPIVDLGNLVNVLDLTNGVTEFRNTGNAVSLLQNMQREQKIEEDDFAENLSRFDWAMQVNDFDQMKASIEDFLSYSSRMESEGAYEDLKSMVVQVIRERFGKVFSTQYSEYNPILEAQQKLELSNWMLDANRYGNALVEASEAQRTLLTTLFLLSRNIDPIETSVRDNKVRIKALEAFQKAADKLQLAEKQLTDLEQTIVDMEEYRSNIKPLRDMFAHNLSESEKTEPLKSLEEAKLLLNQFLESVYRLKRLTSAQEGREELFGLLKSSGNGQNIKGKSRSLVLVVYSSKNRSQWEDEDKVLNGTKTKSRKKIYQAKLKGWKKREETTVWELDGDPFATGTDCTGLIFKLLDILKDYVKGEDLSNVQVCFFDPQKKSAFSIYTILSLNGVDLFEYNFFSVAKNAPEKLSLTHDMFPRLNILSAGTVNLRDHYPDIADAEGRIKLRQIFPQNDAIDEE